MKKTLAAILALVMVLSMLPAGMIMSSALTSGDYTYDVVNSSTAKITKYSGTATNVTVPSTLGGYPVTALANNAFTNCDNLTTLTIGNSVSTIGTSLFSNDWKLTEIIVDDNNTYFSSQDGVLFNKTKTVLISYPLAKTGNYIIPDGVITLNDYSFNQCNKLTGITIPASVTAIGSTAINICSSLNTLVVDSTNNSFTSQDDILFNKTLTKIIKCPDNKTGNYVIPNTVTEIGAKSFYSSKLTGVEFPNSVTKIGDSAFVFAKLTSLTIPDSVTIIENSAFNACSSLRNLSIGSGITSLSVAVFGQCSALTSVVIPATVTAIGNSAFQSCSKLVAAYFLGNTPANVGSTVFDSCASGFTILYNSDKTGFENPWHNYPTAVYGDLVAVCFDLNGGSGNPGACMSPGAALTAPTVTKYGNSFSGWLPAVPPSVPDVNSTYVAQWAPNSYTVVYNSNGATGGSTSSSSHFYGVAKNLTVNGFTKTGYTFSGWATSASGAVAYSDAQSVSGLTSSNGATFMMYAKWTVLEGSVLITFDANGGIGGTSASMLPGAAVTAPTATKTGYTFAGWAPAVPPVVPEASATYTAQWLPNTYTVNYNGNGYTSGSTASSSHTYNLSASLAVNGFTKAGSNFLGWSTNAAATSPTYTDGQSVMNLTASQNGVVTFYAVWAGSPFIITFNSNGGSEVAAITQNNSTAVAKPADPEKTDYTFVGWYADEGLTVAVTWPYTINAADVTFYAKWVLTADTYTISFNSNGSSAVTAITQEANTAVAKPTDPVKTGYNFDGWYSNPELTTPVSWPHTLTGNVTLYAKWVENIVVTITWSPNGGKWPDGTTGSKTTTTLDVPGTLTRTGYSFSGWSPAIPTTMPATNSTFTAQWSINSYTITFSAGYGTGSAAPVTQNYNTLVTLPTTGFTRTGYTFIGWNTSSSATTALSSFTVPAYNATLYAVYTMSYYSLMLKMNNGTNSNFAYFSLPADSWVYYDHFDFEPYDPDDPWRIVPMVIYDPYNPYNPYIYPPIYPPYPPYPPDPPYDPNLYYITIEYPYFTPPPIYGPCGTTECYGYTPPARTGYDFVGWSESPTGTSTTYITHIQAADKTLYAVWTPKSPVTITFNANGGTGGASVQRIPGETLTAPAVARAGYTFIGWSPSVPPSVPAANATYTAQWAANSYLITFDANGGTGGKSSMYNYGATPVPPTVTRTGYDFIGWSPAVAAVTGSATYTAQWILADYMINFDAHYGTGGTGAVMRYGTSLTAPVVSREGYTFLGWSPGVPPTVPPANTTYTAQWSLSSNNLTLFANGGIGGTSFMLEFGSPIAPPQLSREGCIFAGWQPALPSTVVNGLNAYEAQWTVSDYMITFDANGGTGGTSNLRQYCTPLTAPAVTKTGYTFTGWSPEVPAAVPGANTVYVAQWTMNSVEITFDANGGTGGTIGVMACGDSLTPPAVAREGYIFTGWSPAVPAQVIAGNQTYTATWMAVN